jgi:hypothetical protein
MKLPLFIFLIVPTLLLGQVVKVNELINRCIIFSSTGDLPFFGLELKDSNTNYNVKINWGSRTAMNLFNYDEPGRLTLDKS